jgi:Ran GTPase-activating protein (RanGAP) involved in mRNA processing and transport
MGEVSFLVAQKWAQVREDLRTEICKLGFKEVLRGLTGYVNPIFSRNMEVIMGATNKILAKRVDELTEALAEVRENAKEVKETDDMSEVTGCADEIIESVDEVIGPEDDDQDSEDEESEEEPEEESDE